jgi:hypothetical protein
MLRPATGGNAFWKNGMYRPDSSEKITLSSRYREFVSTAIQANRVHRRTLFKPIQLTREPYLRQQLATFDARPPRNPPRHGLSATHTGNLCPHAQANKGHPPRSPPRHWTSTTNTRNLCPHPFKRIGFMGEPYSSRYSSSANPIYVSNWRHLTHAHRETRPGTGFPPRIPGICVHTPKPIGATLREARLGTGLPRQTLGICVHTHLSE